MPYFPVDTLRIDVSDSSVGNWESLTHIAVDSTFESLGIKLGSHFLIEMKLPATNHGPLWRIEDWLSGLDSFTVKKPNPRSMRHSDSESFHRSSNFLLRYLWLNFDLTGLWWLSGSEVNIVYACLPPKEEFHSWLVSDPCRWWIL